MEFDRYKFDKLAIYNSEVHRGLIHTEKYKTEMRLLQVEYDINAYREEVRDIIHLKNS